MCGSRHEACDTAGEGYNAADYLELGHCARIPFDKGTWLDDAKSSLEGGRLTDIEITHLNSRSLT